MIVGARVSELLSVRGLSQAELARRTSLHQSTINGLIHGDQRSSTHLHKIARELRTTPSYLSGETDDPDEGAAPPPPEPTVQHITMQVALPSEAALAAMYEAQLRVFGDLRGAELARALARRLPSGLARLQAGQPYRDAADPPAADEAPPLPAPDHREARRVRRK